MDSGPECRLVAVASFSKDVAQRVGLNCPVKTPRRRRIIGHDASFDLQIETRAFAIVARAPRQNRGCCTLNSTGKFTRQSRLTTKADFDQVFQQCRRSADGIFTVLYRPNGLGYPRLGLAIAKKQVRRAVDRNRLKRLIREMFRTAGPETRDADIVVMVRKKAATVDNAALIASLGRHWQSLHQPADPVATRPVL